MELAYLSAELILTPFDFSKDAMTEAASDVGGFVDSIHFFIGIVIRPTIINIILEFIEPALRLVLAIILTPIMLAIYILQILLEGLIDMVEAARHVVVTAQQKLRGEAVQV